jgi:hypothetical protein
MVAMTPSILGDQTADKDGLDVPVMQDDVASPALEGEEQGAALLSLERLLADCG